MPQPKGKTGNPNGRKPGSVNKATADLRQWLKNFLEDNREQIQKDWKRLSPRDRITLFEKLMKYCVPALQSTTLTTEFDHLSDEQLDEIIQRLKEQIK